MRKMSFDVLEDTEALFSKPNPHSEKESPDFSRQGKIAVENWG